MGVWGRSRCKGNACARVGSPAAKVGPGSHRAGWRRGMSICTLPRAGPSALRGGEGEKRRVLSSSKWGNPVSYAGTSPTTVGEAMPAENRVRCSNRLRESVTLDWSPFLPSNALNSNRQGCTQAAQQRAAQQRRSSGRRGRRRRHQQDAHAQEATRGGAGEAGAAGRRDRRAQPRRARARSSSSGRRAAAMGEEQQRSVA